MFYSTDNTSISLAASELDVLAANHVPYDVRSRSASLPNHPDSLVGSDSGTSTPRPRGGSGEASPLVNSLGLFTSSTRRSPSPSSPSSGMLPSQTGHLSEHALLSGPMGIALRLPSPSPGRTRLRDGSSSPTTSSPTSPTMDGGGLLDPATAAASKSAIAKARSSSAHSAYDGEDGYDEDEIIRSSSVPVLGVLPSMTPAQSFDSIAAQTTDLGDLDALHARLLPSDDPPTLTSFDSSSDNDDDENLEDLVDDDDAAEMEGSAGREGYTGESFGASTMTLTTTQSGMITVTPKRHSGSISGSHSGSDADAGSGSGSHSGSNEDKSSSLSSSSSESDGSPPPPPPVPHPWFPYWSAQYSRYYYVNSDTGSSVWKLPSARPEDGGEGRKQRRKVSGKRKRKVRKDRKGRRSSGVSRKDPHVQSISDDFVQVLPASSSLGNTLLEDSVQVSVSRMVIVPPALHSSTGLLTRDSDDYLSSEDGSVDTVVTASGSLSQVTSPTSGTFPPSGPTSTSNIVITPSLAPPGLAGSSGVTMSSPNMARGSDLGGDESAAGSSSTVGGGGGGGLGVPGSRLDRWKRRASVAGLLGQAGPASDISKPEQGSDKSIVVISEPLPGTEEKGVVATYLMDPSGSMRIMTGTLDYLVRQLANEKPPDTLFIDSFLLNFRQFVDPLELMAMLISRFNLEPPVDASAEEEAYYMMWKNPVRLRVVNVVAKWIERFWSDFEGESGKALREGLNDFLGLAQEAFPSLVAKLEAKIEEKEANPRKMVDSEITSSGIVGCGGVVVGPVSLAALHDENGKTLLRIPAQTLAYVLTQLEMELFASVPPPEFLQQMDKNAHVPHCKRYIDRFNDLSKWVATQVVVCTTPKMRAKVITHFIHVLLKLVNIDNYNTLMAVLSGLSNTAVSRLHKSWAKVSSRTEKALRKLETLMSPSHNYGRYRSVVSNLSPPAVPFLGIFLQDALHHADCAAAIIDGRINFSKYDELSSIVTSLLRFQTSDYGAVFGSRVGKKEWHSAVALLSHLYVMGDKDLFRISRQIEPKQ